MKLLNPTDDQLNAAFAEHVAGMRPHERVAGKWQYLSACGIWMTAALPLSFTTSADAVLPWLEKMAEWEICRAAYSPRGKHLRCRVWKKMTQTSGADDFHTAYDSSFSRAAVIALLRAHGVEVEFK